MVRRRGARDARTGGRLLRPAYERHPPPASSRATDLARPLRALPLSPADPLQIGSGPDRSRRRTLPDVAWRRVARTSHRGLLAPLWARPRGRPRAPARAPRRIPGLARVSTPGPSAGTPPQLDRAGVRLGQPGGAGAAAAARPPTAVIRRVADAPALIRADPPTPRASGRHRRPLGPGLLDRIHHQRG